MENLHPNPEMACHQIATIEQDPLVYDKLYGLYETVFTPYTSATEPDNMQSKDYWGRELPLPNASIFYAVNASQVGEPVGLLFCVPRTHAEIGHELLHIRVAAVLPSYRGYGIFPFLLDEVKQYARSTGYSEISICTFPSRFEKMYPILCSNGWELVTWLNDGEKVLMKLKI